MPKQKDGVKIPRFTISKVSRGEKPVAKLSIPTVKVEQLGDAIQEAYENAVAELGKNKVVPKSCRGVITLY